MIIRNMAKVFLPEEHRLDVLRMYCHESRGGDSIQNYVYQAGTGYAYLPLNVGKLEFVAALLNLKIVDERAEGEPIKSTFTQAPGFKFRNHQTVPAQELLDKTRKGQYSVLKAPCSCGKTVVMTWTAGNLGKKTLVLVDQGNLAGQWQEAYKMVWGHEAHILDSKKDLSNDVVIATFQFLHRHPELVSVMKEMFGTILIDEFHTAGARTYRQVLFKLNSFYRIGTTATVMRKGFSNEILTDLVADVTVEMIDDKALIPEIRFITTDVKFSSNDPTQFTQTLSDLSENDKRNQLLITMMRRDVAAGRKILFIGARVASLKYLQEELVKLGVQAVCYVGSTTLKQDKALRTGLENGTIDVILTDKKAEKGLDLPPLDIIYFAKPMNNQATVTQVAGRVIRPLPGKPAPLVYDFVDHGSLAWRFAANRHHWYSGLGYTFDKPTYFFLDSF